MKKTHTRNQSGPDHLLLFCLPFIKRWLSVHWRQNPSTSLTFFFFVKTGMRRTHTLSRSDHADCDYLLLWLLLFVFFLYWCSSVAHHAQSHDGLTRGRFYSFKNLNFLWKISLFGNNFFSQYMEFFSAYRLPNITRSRDSRKKKKRKYFVDSTAIKHQQSVVAYIVGRRLFSLYL